MAEINLFGIPDKVIHGGVLSCLSVNEVLRLRRVCKKAQGVTESYLRTHPRSNEVITFDLVFKPSKLSEFLVEDSFCSIPKPVSGFKIHFDSPEQLQNPKLTEFLARYGVQVFELEVKHMNLPLNQQEFIFYEKLPNLKSLTIQFLDEIEGAQARLAASVFPESFRNLKSLIIMEEDTDLPKADFKWKLVEFCKDLERFGCRADPKRYSNLHQILDRNEHTKLKFYDMKPDAYELPVENIGELCKTTIKFNMKWENVPSAGLFQIWRPQLEKIAPHIVSLDFFKGIEDIQGVVLSNIESIRATFGAGEDEVVIDEDDVVDEEDYNLDDIPALLRSVKPKVGSAVFPNLKRLQMLIRLGTHSSRILGGIWEVLTHLEDVTIEAGSTHVGDEAFVGEFIGNPSFRKLTKLKILRLQAVGSLTDAVFRQVFRHLKLREFYIDSQGTSIKSITAHGIRHLLTGPFKDSIEKFPFGDSWALAGMNNFEFRKLGMEFPNNQAL